MKRKLASVCLVVVVMVACLAGCGGKTLEQDLADYKTGCTKILTDFSTTMKSLDFTNLSSLEEYASSIEEKVIPECEAAANKLKDLEISDDKLNEINDKVAGYMDEYKTIFSEFADKCKSGVADSQAVQDFQTKVADVQKKLEDFDTEIEQYYKDNKTSFQN